MALCVCKCLNVTMESENYEENVDISKLELTSTEQRDNFFSEVQSVNMSWPWLTEGFTVCSLNKLN
jgi:hypothetical protein